jgi:hypothetical protein
VNGHADIAAGRKKVADAGPIDEIESRGVRQLVHPERHFEFSAPNLRVPEVLKIDIDVTPGVLSANLTLNLELEMLQKDSLDADTSSGQIEPIAIWSDIWREIVKIALDLGHDIEAQRIANGESQRIGVGRCAFPLG